MKLSELMTVIGDLVTKGQVNVKSRTTLRDYSFVIINAGDYRYIAELDSEQNVKSLERLSDLYDRIYGVMDES
ncbi:hypothetical protein [Leptospira noguchii]|uniref:Uncharacterized protein n=1 Tax=Leptospira noguchii serovar Panama str. CZ214 TaxID=1001595 RepID=T0FK93_9LEPT|nr:hypothetical protein [Leptospira noguchii]EQA70000.1 hypothetical protein LEP1GSC059_2310 [Leptospira noguchii serovar Panama str. CZ214]